MIFWEVVAARAVFFLEQLANNCRLLALREYERSLPQARQVAVAIGGRGFSTVGVCSVGGAIIARVAG